MSSGKCRWLIPDMFWPASSAEGVCVSHEAICVLNLTDEPCDIDITLYFEQDEPLRLPVYTCGAKRTKHIRLDAALDGKGEHIPAAPAMQPRSYALCLSWCSTRGWMRLRPQTAS